MHNRERQHRIPREYHFDKLLVFFNEVEKIFQLDGGAREFLLWSYGIQPVWRNGSRIHFTVSGPGPTPRFETKGHSVLQCMRKVTSMTLWIDYEVDLQRRIRDAKAKSQREYQGEHRPCGADQPVHLQLASVRGIDGVPPWGR